MWGGFLGILGLLMFLGGWVSLVQLKRGRHSAWRAQKGSDQGGKQDREIRKGGIGVGPKGCECRFRISKFWPEA